MDIYYKFENFMKYGEPAILADMQGNLDQFLISQRVEDEDESEEDLEDLDFIDEFDGSIFNKDMVNHLQDLGFRYKQMRKLGVRIGYHTDPGLAYHYALEMGLRWPEGEPAILTDVIYTCYYIKDILKRPWPEAEDVIKQDPGWAVWYATSILKRRWPEGEEAIKKYPLDWDSYIRFLEQSGSSG